MKRQSIKLIAALLIVFYSHPSFAQDSGKGGFIKQNAQTFSASMLGSEVACTANRAAGYPCESINLTAFLSIADMAGTLNTGSVEANDLWGWTDSETGREYAILGMDNGTMFIELSTPVSPKVVGFLVTHTVASSWRDMKVYNDYAFIVADAAGNHGIQIIDLKSLRNLTDPVRLQETAHYDGFGSAHNIVINEDTGFAYAVGSNSGGNTCGGGLHMINIQDPVNPVFAGCFADPNTGYEATGYTHDAQCVVYAGPDTEHQGKEICIGSNETHISIADVTDKSNPVALSKGTYPRSDYIHQGWLSEDQRYFFQDDEGDESSFGGETRTIIWDLEDLDDPVYAGDFFSGVRSIDHNMYARGNYLYQANYTSGLRIWNIADPTNPQFVAYFDTYPDSDADDFFGAWSSYPYFDSGIVIVSSIEEGLFVLSPQLAKATTIEALEVPQSLFVSPPFPNPSREAAAIEVKSRNGGSIQVEIVNATGRIVRMLRKDTATPNATVRFEIDTNGLSSGSYIVRVSSASDVQTYPLTILK